MAVYVDVRRGSMVLSDLYCRVKMLGGAKSSAHYQIEICTDQNGPSLPVLDVSQVYYMFGEKNEAAGYQGAPFDVTAAPWAQAYADLKHRFSKGLLTWCVAMREESQASVTPS